MTSRRLISIAALLLPGGMAYAQSYGPADTPAPAQGANPAPTGNPAEAVQGTPATDADLTKGKVVKDKAGQTVGTIDSTTDAGVVLSVGEQRIQVPKSAVGKNDGGLFISVTRAELEAAAGKRSAS